MYRASGPAEMRSVGEVERVRGIAAQSDSGLYGPTKVAAGIVGYADLNLGAPRWNRSWKPLSRLAAAGFAASATPAVGTLSTVYARIALDFRE